MLTVDKFFEEKFKTGRTYTKEELIQFATEYNKHFLLDLSKKLDEQAEKMGEFKTKLEDVLLPNDLDYLEKHWAQKEKRIESIIAKLKELPKMEGMITEVAKNIATVSYSKTGNTWGFVAHESEGLKALADKITHMIRTGKADGIKRMVEKIASGRIKKLSQIDKYDDNEYLGKGHFRWNWKAYLLSKEEIEKLKTFFKITDSETTNND